MPAKVRPPERPAFHLKPTFLNVDLDLSASTPLAALAEAFGSAVDVLLDERIRRTWWLRLELSRQPKSADAAIRSFCKLVAVLPDVSRSLWDSAKSRDFSVGIRSGIESAWVEPISPATVRAVAALNASISLVVYSPRDAEVSSVSDPPRP